MKEQRLILLKQGWADVTNWEAEENEFWFNPSSVNSLAGHLKEGWTLKLIQTHTHDIRQKVVLMEREDSGQGVN